MKHVCCVTGIPTAVSLASQVAMHRDYYSTHNVGCCLVNVYICPNRPAQFKSNRYNYSSLRETRRIESCSRHLRRCQGQTSNGFHRLHAQVKILTATSSRHPRPLWLPNCRDSAFHRLHAQVKILRATSYRLHAQVKILKATSSRHPRPLWLAVGNDSTRCHLAGR